MKPDIAEKPKSRRRWLQFRLRSVFILMLLIGVGMTWLVAVKKKAERQRAIVEQIRKDGGWVFYDYQFDHSGRLIARAEPAAPAWLRMLLGDDFFTNVVGVHAKSRGILGSLRELDRLATLDLMDSNLGDADLAHLQ